MQADRPTLLYSSATVRSMQPDETVQEFAARMLVHHGPPPRHVVEMVHQLQRQAADRENEGFRGSAH